MANNNNDETCFVSRDNTDDSIVSNVVTTPAIMLLATFKLEYILWENFSDEGNGNNDDWL